MISRKNIKQENFIKYRIFVIIHQPHGGAQGQASDIEISARRIIRIRALLNQIISERSGQPLKKVEKDMDRDFFLSAEEAENYGIIDQVIQKQS